MKKRIVITSLLAGGALLLGSAAMAGQPKVNVCHRPPGNPANFNIISVAPSAVPAHLAHGDNVVGPEICGDGIDNDCNGVVDDANVCGPAVLDCRCVFPNDIVFSGGTCLNSVAACGSPAGLCDELCVERFGQVVGQPLVSSTVLLCQPAMCNPQ